VAIVAFFFKNQLHMILPYFLAEARTALSVSVCAVMPDTQKTPVKKTRMNSRRKEIDVNMFSPQEIFIPNFYSSSGIPPVFINIYINPIFKATIQKNVRIQMVY
jgi:hypothetical protein